MILDEKTIQQEKKVFGKKAKNIAKTCNLYDVISDPTRLKIIILLKKHKKICVTDLAEIINVSISAISHQLKLLEKCDIVKSQKMGKMVCYRLAQKELKININI
jgi:DNA-binding transcriptional ArsR family regulator